MPSAHHDKLVADLLIAKKITYSVPPNVCNTVIQDLKIKSYIFLSHAIIEEYLETIALETAEKALRLYIDERKICRGLVGLISSGLIARVEENGISKKIRKELFEDIGTFSSTAYGRFRSLVGENNGIKKSDQQKLFLPIGIDPELEDAGTMATLDGFGGKRGSIAHNFKIAKAHTLSEIDGDLNTIKLGLENYDLACENTLCAEVSEEDTSP